MKTLAIVGSHPGTRDDAPWGNPAVDILVFNEAAAQTWVKRWNYVLQLHTPTIYRNPHNRTDPGHWAWLQKDHGAGKVIYMQDKDAAIPNSRKFPLAEVVKLVNSLTIAAPGGIEHVKPFTNSISFALALGIHLGYGRILLYGSEMASNTEYAYQRENFLFWLGVCAGRGVRLEMHSGQSMVTGAMYGYDGDLTYDPAMFDAGVKDAQKRLKVARVALKGAEQNLAMVDPRDKGELVKLMRAALDANFKVGEIAGELCTARRYAIKARAMVNTTGTAVISRQEFEQGSAAARAKFEEVKQAINRLDGQLDMLQQSFQATGDTRHMQGFAQVARMQHLKARYWGVFKGRSTANTALMLEADKKLMAAGGQKSYDAYTVQLSQAQPAGVMA